MVNVLTTIITTQESKLVGFIVTLKNLLSMKANV